MSSRPLVILGIIIILIAVIAAAGFVMNERNASPIQNGTASTDSNSTAADQSNGSSTAPADISPTFYQSTSTTDSTASSGGSDSNPSGASTGADAGQSSGRPDMNGSISLSDIPFPASTTMSTASWVAYVDNADGYSYEHPADMTQNAVSGNAAFTFTKNAYFHWPLLDDAKVSVTVAPSCPKITDPAVGQAPVQFALNGYQFTRTIGSDVGAGQLYTEVAYDTQANGNCYHIYFLDHATDGAGFYVDDASLIAKYDAQHVSDLSAVISAFNAIVGSFHILVPAR